MKTITRRRILRANAVWLLLASIPALATDLTGAFLGRGPQAAVLGNVPEAAIGFVEAHGLALILGVLLWNARPQRSWHLTGAAIHLLLGTSNLLFWQLFETAGVIAMGWITTTLHFAFVLLQLRAAASDTRAASVSNPLITYRGANP